MSRSGPSRALRLAVVGARQTRHGVGGWLARRLAEAGAEIAAVVGTRLATAATAADALAPDLGYRPLPLASPDDVGRLPDLDALVVASPAPTHAAWLKWAVGRGLHVLCEKPLVWGAPDAPMWSSAIAQRFLQRGLHLVVNAQWPYALPAFAALHPDVDFETVTSLRMRLAPPGRGPEMVPDAMPHALSLLQALAPDPDARLHVVSAAWGDEDGRALALRGTFAATSRRIAFEVDLAQGGASPRAFSVELDGRAAARRVDEGYVMRLVDGARDVPLPDPMAALASAFLARLRDGSAPQVDLSAVPGVAHLAQIAAALPALAVTEIPYP